MIDEVQLLRQDIDAKVDSEPDLEPIRRNLAAAIEEELVAGTPNLSRSSNRHRVSRIRRISLSLGGLAVAGVVVALVLALVTTSPTPHSEPKAIPKPFPSHLPVGDQLRLIAVRASEQPIPHLKTGQALFTHANLSVVASVNNGAAQATIGLSVQKWSTASGLTCTTLTAQPAQFASPAEQAAWVGLHLLVTPRPQSASQCLAAGSGATPPDAITGAGQLINVSSLPTDPSVLAQRLESGTTGISVLDQLLPDEAAPNPGFQRAAMLLIGPTVGATPQFNADLYHAIALLPGATALGPMTTSDGEAGQGFASGPGAGQTTIIVDPSTGRLLEVRGLDDSDSLTSIAGHYLSGELTVNEYSAQLQWLDPIGSPSVIGLSPLPAGLPVYVFATTKPGLASSQAFRSINRISQPYFRFFTSASSDTADPANPNASGLFQWSFADNGPEVKHFVQSLRASGLFTSVTEI
jgi:hypothetical protein